MNTSEFYKPVRCHYCKNLEAPMIEPTGKKRLVLLVCARCGNSMRVQYMPKKRRQPRENPSTD